jgi:D-alanine-D-alanine ligase
MPVPPLRIAILHYQPSGEPADPVVEQIADALKANGHDPVAIGVDESVRDLLNQIEKAGADLVFNICETFADDYRLEVNVAAVLELARVKHTGSGTAGLLLAQDKILTKQLLDYHEVLTPKFATFDGQTFETHGNLSFPLIVKPAKSDASLGINLAGDWEELTKKVREIRKEFDDDALAEEFIEGREVYVGVIGDTARPEILPLVELDFGKKWAKSEPKIANREVKFGPETKDSPKLIFPREIPDELRGKIERSALLAYRALKLRDYARIDFRVSTRTGEPYILDVNPNPYLARNCEVAMAAREKGLSYEQLVGRIVESAAARYKLLRKAQPSQQPPAPQPEAGKEPAADSATHAP